MTTETKIPFSSPMSYSTFSEASSLAPPLTSHDRPPPPSQKKMVSLLSFDESPILAAGDNKSPRHEAIQDVMRYIDNMTFSPPQQLLQKHHQPQVVNQHHSLYLPSPGLRDITNDRTTQNYTPIRSFLERSGSSTYRLDPIGKTPIKPRENHVRDQSIFLDQRREQPDGNSPMKAKESHVFEASRYYGHQEEEEEEENLAKGRKNFPLLDPDEQELDKSVQDAWSIVLGSTIIEEEDENQSQITAQKDLSTLQIHRPKEGEEGVEAGQSIRVATPEDAKRLLKTAVDTLQDARAERESARLWASTMKDAVNKWVEEQRQLVRCESNVEFQQQQMTSLSNLEQSILKLDKDIQLSNRQRQTTEEKLQQLLLEQQEKITALCSELVTMKQQIIVSSSQNNKQTIEEYKNTTPQQANGGSRRKLNKKQSPSSPSSTTSSRIRRQTKDGGHVILYGTGVRKEVHKDGTTVIRFPNGDVETKFPTGTTAYFHASENVMEINSNGSTLFEYPNRQIERHDKDGSKTILFADGTRQRISADGKVETTFA